MLPVTSRLKDVLWTLRQQIGIEADVDRIIPYLAFEKNLDQDQLENLFITHPVRTPEAWKPALLARIREIVRYYWSYRTTRKGYHKVLKGIIFLENVARQGFDGCKLVFDKNTGYRLEVK